MSPLLVEELAIMKTTARRQVALAALVAFAGFFGTTLRAVAHCDTLDGPVVMAARKALAESKVNLVLVWVQKHDEAEIKRAFEQTLAVRKLNAEARDLADMYFFETLVRVHRAGEGAPYTGLQPAGAPGGAIPAADSAIESGKLGPVSKLLAGVIEEGLHKRFEEVQALKKFKEDDVAAGRRYVAAYVKFVHYVEGVHEAAQGAAEHLHDQAKPTAHEHK